MMTSTFPTTRSNGHNLKYGIRELQHKKEILLNLEVALKKRVNEFRQLCLKEGELTGHLPADYPLQPREPIPQVRRRITRSNGNIPSELHSSLSSGSLMPPTASVPPSSLTSLHKTSEQVSHQHHSETFALPNAKILTHPSRPTSTTSSTSTASSSLNKQALGGTRLTNPPTSMTTNRMHSSAREIHRISNFNDEINQIYRNDSHNFNNMQPTEHTAAIMLQRRQKQLQQQRQHQQQQMMNKQSDQLFTLPDHFKKPFALRDSANPNFDSDSLGNIRASSTASSSSSSGSAASSTVSAFAAIPCQPSQRYVDNNLHVRSCSESVPNNGQLTHPLARPTLTASQTNFNPHNDQPIRPPRGTHSQTSQARTIKPSDTQSLDGNRNGLMGCITGGGIENPIDEKLNLHHTVVNHFQPYYEETKPFQMSDFYKYSAKHRQHAASPEPVNNSSAKTTRQLQDEIATMRQPLKMTACDDQIQASRKLIERSGQKFMNATAKAIACNPSLAERLNNIIPNHHGEGY